MLITDLPVETILYILQYLPVSDILTLRQSCKELNAVTYDRSVWSDALSTHVIGQNIPIPRLRERPLLSLNAMELENLVHRTFQLHRNWISPSPIPTGTHDLIPRYVDSDHSKVTGIHFLPGKGNRWLLYMGFYVHPIEALIYSTLTCWDLHTHPPTRCASIDYEPERMSWCLLLVNTDPTHSAAFTVSRGAFVRSGGEDVTTNLAYGMNENDNPSMETGPFTVLSQFTSSTHPRALHGSMLFFEIGRNDILDVQVRDVLTGKTMAVLRVPFDVADPIATDDRVKSFYRVFVFGQYIVMFRRRRILLYYVPAPLNTNPDNAFVEPIDICLWQWRIDSIDYSLKKPDGSSSSIYPPLVTLLVRYDSYYPWPVNLLHQFILRPNPEFDPSGPQPSRANLPYILQPMQITTIASPMRMFTPSDMVLGPYGTALWIDAQTDPNPTQAGDHGQRIAGRFLSMDGAPAHQEGGDNLNGRQQTKVFHISEAENVWNRLAVDEEEGRVAVARVDGKVTLFDYARQD